MGPKHICIYTTLILLGNITRRASNSEVHLHTPSNRRDVVQQKAPNYLCSSSSKATGVFGAVWREAGAYI